jgi:hypothetical protein
MQGGKNWIWPKKRPMQTGSSETLIGWKSEAVRHEREISNAETVVMNN